MDFDNAISRGNSKFLEDSISIQAFVFGKN